MSASEVDSYSNTFILPKDKLRAYIYDKNYFSKILLPYNPLEGRRYCEVKCLLPINTSNPSNICNKVWKIYYRNTSTSNFHAHLKKSHPSIPRSKEEESRSRVLEGIYIILIIINRITN